MKTISYLGAMCTLILSNQSFANLPQKNNPIYQKTTKCVDININSLKKEYKDFLKDHQYKLEKVQECNDREFPIYIGRTQYDLTYAANLAYAQRFFNALAQLNQKDSFAVVDTFSQKIFYVKVQKNPFKANYSVESY